jgi:hypothetical protein
VAAVAADNSSEASNGHVGGVINDVTPGVNFVGFRVGTGVTANGTAGDQHLDLARQLLLAHALLARNDITSRSRRGQVVGPLVPDGYAGR